MQLLWFLGVGSSSYCRSFAVEWVLPVPCESCPVSSNANASTSNHGRRRLGRVILPGDSITNATGRVSQSSLSLIQQQHVPLSERRRCCKIILVEKHLGRLRVARRFALPRTQARRATPLSDLKIPSRALKRVHGQLVDMTRQHGLRAQGDSV